MESAVNTPTTSGRLPSNPQGLPPTSFEGFKTRFIASKETRQGVRKIRLTFVCSNPFEEKVVETPDTVAFISIGRNKNCTVTIPKVQQLSQIHCQIIRKENEEGVVHYEVENCSTNGVSINGFKMATSGTAKLKNGDLLTMIHDPPFAVISCRFELLGTPPSPKRATKRKSYGVEIIDVKRGTHSQSPDVIFTDGEGTATEPFILTNIREGHTNFPSKKRLREEQEKRQAIISSLTNLSAGGDMPPQVRTLMNTLGNALQCSICLELLHKPIVITPCAHRFCAGCLSTLLGSPTNHNYAANCPNCRGNITSFMKDAQLREVIDGYLNFFPSERQSEEHRNALDAVDYISGREGTSFDFKKPRQTATRGRGRRSR
ncbi:hypothetical protein L596_017828 [Steinernema carpocapsae]|uniref:E3 ubiquitin-protein ligase CHFR n=1 Tax=Steinernema carpocapsae TaxID=34508 RepID=A0A4V6A1U3_STECR|nr:hypothetical protein L596_017828 [Steinernema carpocapsae]